MDKLRIGTAGIPASTKPRSTANAVKRLAELGLRHMEIEFVRGVRMGESTAEQIKALAEEHDISLTVHAPYYVNLNSAEPEKIAASKDRIIQAARAGAWAGARSVTFHAAYYHDDDPQKVYARVKHHMEEMLERLEQEGIDIRLSPETTGGPSQFGTLEELVRLGEDVPGVYPCVDFSHLFARSIGEYNSYEHFAGTLQLIQDKLGKGALKELHIHLSGIEYGPKGEKKHLPLAETELKYKEVIQALIDFEAAGWLTCESPILEEDALILQGLYNELKNT
ncbi:MAG: TIM barrel protein [Firmicutes bacterium]|nr:TIM barrel protein [Bacillota bacterium]